MTVSPSQLRPIKFDWDKGNKYKNWKKHKVNYQECEQVFFNKPLKFFPDPKHSKKEIRLVALGITNQHRKLILIFTLRNTTIRVISARNMSQKERRAYGKKQTP